MKKLIFYLFLLLSRNLIAFEDFELKWNIGNLGLGMNIFQDGGNTESFVDIFNIGIEHSDTGIGIEYSPVKYWSWTNENIYYKNIEASSFSFLNFNIYWNVVDFYFSNDVCNFFFGPFNKINYALIDDYDFRWNEYVYTVGLRIGLDFIFYKNIHYHIIGGEIGYRKFNGKNTFYTALTIDIVVFSLAMFS